MSGGCQDGGNLVSFGGTVAFISRLTEGFDNIGVTTIRIMNVCVLYVVY